MTINNNSVSAINEALLYLQRQMAEVKTLIDNSTEVSLSELTSRVDTLQVMVRSLSTQVSDMSGSISSLSSQVASMLTDVNSIAARMSSAESSISSLQFLVSALQTTVSNLQSTIDTLSSRMGTAESNISSLQTSVSSLNSSISILQSQMTTLNNSISALMNRVSALETWKNSYNPMPIGAIYMQIHGRKAPADIWGGTWTNISSDVAGLFMRAEGGNALSFGGGIQNEAMRTHVHWQYMGDTTDSGFNGWNYYTTDIIASGGGFLGWLPVQADTYNNGRYVGGGQGANFANETRPINLTVRYWQRTA